MQEMQRRVSISGWGSSPGTGHGNPLQLFLPGESQDRGTWRSTVHGVAKSQTWLKWLSRHADTLFYVLVVVWKDHIWGLFRLPNSKILKISLFSGRDRKRGERGKERWGPKVALCYYVNLKKWWCFEAEPVIHNGDPDSVMLENWTFSVWLYSSRLPSTNWKIVIIFSITKKMCSIWNSCDRYKEFRKDDRLQCNYCITRKRLSRSQNLVAWRDLRDTLVNPRVEGFRSHNEGTAKTVTCVREGPVSPGECQGLWPPVWRSLPLPCFLCYIKMSEFLPNMPPQGGKRCEYRHVMSSVPTSPPLEWLIAVSPF